MNPKIYTDPNKEGDSKVFDCYWLRLPKSGVFFPDGLRKRTIPVRSDESGHAAAIKCVPKVVNSRSAMAESPEYPPAT